MNAAEVARRAALADIVPMSRRARRPRQSGAALCSRTSVERARTAVLSCGARGLHRKATASYLGCSAGTVDTYWRRILSKTDNLRSRQ